MYKEHTETFSASEQETALGRVSELYKDNLDHYKKAMSGKKKNKSSHSSHNSPTPVY